MESVAQSIVSKFGQLLVDELQQIRGVGEKVVHLADELATMNAVLRMISEADESSVDHLVREWEKQVRELAYDAEDFSDIYWLRIGRRHIPLQLPYIVKWPKYQLEKLQLQRTLAADIKSLLARASAVSERRARYGIDQAALARSARFAPVSALSTSSASALRRADDPDVRFVGIREQVDTLVESIRAVHAEAEHDESLKVFSIVGSGGLGKTTLAVELCRQLDADFQRQAMVSVSQAFDAGKDIKGLLLRVLKQMDSKTEGSELDMDQMDVEEKLKEILKDKRYLIVIDDVWSLPAWEAIRIRLPENNYGSRVIVTTQIDKVAKASSVSEDFIHHMKPMELKASEELFIKRVFGSTGTCPDCLKDTMSKILKKCGGLPLAIVRIASLLASYNSDECAEMWRKVSNSLGSQMDNHPTLEGMRQVIKLSYDYLPYHLKACMMYLSIFPEDYVIAKDRLLYRWIAEGLVPAKRGLTMFDVAEEYFNELMSRNMIQPDKLLMGTMFLNRLELVEACRVHDMMLEFMVSKSEEANFVTLVGRQYGGGFPRGKVRRLTVHGNVDDDKEHNGSSTNKMKKVVEHHHYRARHGIEAMNLQYVRSLTTFQLEGLDKRLLDRLDEFKLLRILDLEGCEALQDKHMRYVCRLYLLRFLGLRCTSISKMPNRIGDLECLETLDVDETRIYGMPRTVTKLSKLERLRVFGWILPRGLGNMKALRDVAWARLENDAQVARDIGELQQLQELSILLGKEDKEPGKKFLRALASSLSKIYALRSLVLSSFNPGLMTLNFLLDVSSPPPLLQRLVMRGCISRLPDWISSLKHLVEFSVYWTRLDGKQLLDSLCKLPTLQSVELGYESCADRVLVVHTTHIFPALRILNLSGIRENLQVVKFVEGSMTKLETLVLEFSNQGRTIVGIGNLKNLKEVKLSGLKINQSLERALQQLKKENENRPDSKQTKVVVKYR